MTVGLLQGVEVADGGAALDAAGGLDRAGLPQQRFGQGGLAAAPWPTSATVRMDSVVYFGTMLFLLRAGFAGERGFAGLL